MPSRELGATLDSGFDPDGDWAAVLIGSSEEVAPAKLRAIAWRARVGLQAGFGTVRFIEESGLTTVPLQHRPGAADLLETTFDAYLRHSGNSSKICEELSIHRNTVSYRLRKIEELLKLDLSDWEVRATCLLALGIVAASQ